MLTPADKKDAPIYQLKVTLTGSRPPIWRRIQISGETHLHKLHRILQIVMGWEDYHLHQFVVGERYYGTSQPDFDLEMEVKDERTVTLGGVAPAVGQKFTYEYDFGDSWEHEILVEKILKPAPGVRYPVCIKGKRACPPEDCGGIWGYESFLEAIRDPNQPEHEEMLEWIGESFDPEAFDLEAVNRELAALRSDGDEGEEERDRPRFGRLPPRYAFALNPYEDVRFSKCPQCYEPTRLRKFALLIYIERFGLLSQGKTCRCCPGCELLIVHQDELEAQLATGLWERAPEVIGNDYFVVGTVERKIWRRGLRQPQALSFEELRRHTADFKTILEIEYEPGGWYPSGRSNES